MGNAAARACGAGKSLSMKYADIFLGVPVDQSFTYQIAEGMNLHEGMRVLVPFGRRSETGFVARIHDEKPQGFEAKAILEVYDDVPVFDERLLSLCRTVSSFYICSVGEALSVALPSGKSSGNRMKKRFSDSQKSPSEIKLNEEQQSAFDGISAADAKPSHLLYGVTGSGKTEVYLSLVEKTLHDNKSAIVLVPEISLSAHLYERFHEFFGDELILYHSGLTPNQRLMNWKRFYSGESRVAVGTRSAVFLQCPSLGLVVIDEEHDGSYKEHSTPRYNARRIALWRSRSEGATVVLGSATPSVETMYAARSGIMGLYELKSRFGNTAMPEIEIVEIEGKRDDDMISIPLKIATKHTVDEKRQAIFLLNRRGFSPIVFCRSCTKKVECPHCSIAMNYHNNDTLVCHYCGYTINFPDKCPSCKSDDLAKLGSGTQRIEELIEKTFHGFRIFRLDQDSARKKDSSYDLIRMMRDGEIDILLGTQMVSKGFDFRNVDLVGVILADIGMSLPDFRASERIFSLLSQVAGRCGRGDRQGKVIIQTLSADNELLRFVANHDYESFYQREIELRKMLSYPPFSRIARLLVRGSDEDKVHDAAQKILAIVKEAAAGKAVSVLGPSPAPIEKIGGNYRHHIIIKARDTESLAFIARSALKGYGKSEPYLEIDIDPVDML
jgi:primosomal protein N' (replication factor Y) (superfamily II helicase)